jgi:hypothetical protein
VEYDSDLAHDPTHLPTNGELTRLSPALVALTALSQPYRLLLFRAILAAGEQGLSRPELGQRLRMAGSALTFHLRTLADAQLIETRRTPGGSHVCVARRDYLRGLMEWVIEPPVSS